MLEVDGIRKSYFGHEVLSPISFCLPAGCCLGVTGENGSGKSTVLRMLAQIERPDGGDIRYGGESVLGNRNFLRRTMGYVPQQIDLMEELTVQNQLKLWQSACGLSGPLPEDILELLDVKPMLKSQIRHLSGGMKRRVSIAAALLSHPDILVMDEATSGLDQEYCSRLLAWLEDYLKRNGRVVWCSHHAQELNRLCGACLEISGGKQIR